MINIFLPEGRVISLGHFTDISEEIINASSLWTSLPAGTFLGYTDSIIGLSTGAHLHMQATMKGEYVQAEEFWGWLHRN